MKTADEPSQYLIGKLQTLKSDKNLIKSMWKLVFIFFRCSFEAQDVSQCFEYLKAIKINPLSKWHFETIKMSFELAKAFCHLGQWFFKFLTKQTLFYHFKKLNYRYTTFTVYKHMR